MCLIKSGDKFRASDSVQAVIRNRIGVFYEKPDKNMHRVRVRVPVTVAQVSGIARFFFSVGLFNKPLSTLKKMDH